MANGRRRPIDSPGDRIASGGSGAGFSAGASRTTVIGIAALVILIVLAIGGCSTLARVDAGQVGVVRNGGPLDNKDIRQILQPGSAVTYTGVFSEDPHEYPAATVQRFYQITSDQGRGEREGVDVVQVPTADGVSVGLEATIYFNFVGEANQDLLKRFDSNIGLRTFPVASTGERLHAYEGDQGFAAMLDTVLRPVIDNDLRQEIGSFRCAELVSSCALIQQGQEASESGKARTTPDGRATNANLQAVQEKINRSLAEDIRRTFGADYFTNIRFNLSRVTLPSNVQRAIDEAQSAFAEVSKARARVRQAEFQNRANRQLARTYEQSPGLAQIEAIKNIPPGSEVIFNVGAGGSPGLNVGRGR